MGNDQPTVSDLVTEGLEQVKTRAAALATELEKLGPGRELPEDPQARANIKIEVDDLAMLLKSATDRLENLSYALSIVPGQPRRPTFDEMWADREERRHRGD